MKALWAEWRYSRWLKKEVRAKRMAARWRDTFVAIGKRRP